MIDCSKTENFLKELNRMCKINKSGCPDCPYYELLERGNWTCMDIFKEYTQEAIEILQKWSDEHPRKTYLEDIKEKFPDLNEDGLIDVSCPEDFYGDTAKSKCEVYDHNCEKCWNQSMKE